MQTTAFEPHRTLAELATRHAGATRVFQRHGLDFCCHGQISLADACAARALDLDALQRELAAEEHAPADFERWDERPLGALIDHVLARYHEPHRSELVRLLAMARKVAAVHGAKPAHPAGLLPHLERMADEIELHMRKEEQVLFPLIRGGHGRMAGMPIETMEREHEDHGRNLELLRGLTDGYRAPADACNTWKALYLGLAELERELMEHIHLENNVLFPRALRG
jgi:regulator of cell morphogenesis and NO signaling